MPKKVLLLFEAHLPHDLMGMVRYAKKVGWFLDASVLISHSSKPSLTALDGVLAAHLKSETMLETLVASGIPWVEIGWGADGIDVPKVWMDNRKISQMATEHLTSLGLKSLAFFSTSETLWTQQRRDGFRESLDPHGLAFADLNPSNIHDLLPTLPKPLGIYAVEDSKAVAIIQYCDELGLDIPTEVAVLGVDNHPEFCELARIPITTIDAGRDMRGYRAAELLDSLMDGGAPPDEPILVPPTEIIVRQSTDILAVPHPKAAKAIGVINQNYPDPELTVDAISREVGITRRQLDAVFVTHINRTVAAELERQRLKEAEHLLLNDAFSIADIAETCGFSNYAHLSRALKNATGFTARAYRAEHKVHVAGNELG